MFFEAAQAGPIVTKITMATTAIVGLINFIQSLRWVLVPRNMYHRRVSASGRTLGSALTCRQKRFDLVEGKPKARCC
jgi:hypothetical protein